VNSYGAAGMLTGTIGLIGKNQAFQEFRETGTADASNAIRNMQFVTVVGFGVGTVLLVGGAAVAATSMMIE
jgi:hypothetical protein